MPVQGPSPIVLATDRFALAPADAVLRAGMIALSSDLTSEGDAVRLLPPHEVRLHVSRVAFENPTTPENLRRMAPRLTEAAQLLVPGAPLAAIYFSCTSGSVVIGDAAIDAAIGAARPGVPVVTPTRAALAALAALDVRRIALVTPYLAETAAPMAEYFRSRGIEVVRAVCFGFADDRNMARIEPGCIVEAVAEADAPDVEALFLSCTALQALDVVAPLEARLGKPVLTSNQAGFWALRHHAGLRDIPAGYGRLFATPPTGSA